MCSEELITAGPIHRGHLWVIYTKEWDSPFNISLLQLIADHIFRGKKKYFKLHVWALSQPREIWINMSTDGFQKEGFLGNQVEDGQC